MLVNGVVVHVVPCTVVAAIANVWIVAVDWIWVDAARTAPAMVIAMIAIGISGSPWKETLTMRCIFMVCSTGHFPVSPYRVAQHDPRLSRRDVRANCGTFCRIRQTTG